MKLNLKNQFLGPTSQVPNSHTGQVITQENSRGQWQFWPLYPKFSFPCPLVSPAAAPPKATVPERCTALDSLWQEGTDSLSPLEGPSPWTSYSGDCTRVHLSLAQQGKETSGRAGLCSEQSSIEPASLWSWRMWVLPHLQRPPSSQTDSASLASRHSYRALVSGCSAQALCRCKCTAFLAKE